MSKHAKNASKPTDRTYFGATLVKKRGGLETVDFEVPLTNRARAKAERMAVREAETIQSWSEDIAEPVVDWAMAQKAAGIIESAAGNLEVLAELLATDDERKADQDA